MLRNEEHPIVIAENLLINRKKLTLYDVLKRILDFSFSIIMLIIFSPLFTIIAISIVLDSPGPVFIKQERLGKYGIPFTLYKFRTMYVDSNKVLVNQYISKLIVSKNTVGKFSDPRISRVGRLLRKYSLDELPQFFNIFMGDMSLVGPRPMFSYEISQYSGKLSKDCLAKLLEALPGITGLSQLNAFNWRMNESFSIDDVLLLDLEYIDKRSFYLDFVIILRTFPIGIKHL